jgi:hypothetical protein
MLPEYTLIPVPLGTESPQDASREFPVEIVTSLNFPEGEHSPATVIDVLAQHPILGRTTEQVILAFAMDFGAWQLNGRRFDSAQAIPLTLRYAGSTPLSLLARTLSQYLVPSAPVSAAKFEHDSRFDLLQHSDFLDVTKAYDDLSSATQGLQRSAGRSLRLMSFVETDSQSQLSMDAVRWVNAATQATLLGAIDGSSHERVESALSEFGISDHISALRTAVAKVNRRLAPPGGAAPCENSGAHSLQAVTSNGPTEVSTDDPNVALHAALKNSLLSRSCGLVTSWTCTADTAVAGDFILHIPISSLTWSAAAVNVVSKCIAFRRAEYTHPLAFSDINKRTTNAALAFLNEDDGKARYRASCIHTETTLAKQLIVQAKNSIADPSASDTFGDFTDTRDERPPQLLATQQFGVSEPETSGVILSAPIEDIATPDALRKATAEERENVYPCLFLEDVWIGFRLDLQHQDTSPFSSVHKQRQLITFSLSDARVAGATEDYFEREQRDDRDYTSTEFATYNGLSTAQVSDYLQFLGIDRQSGRPASGPFSIQITGYEASSRLLFGRVYRYRLRNVFIGGVGFSATQAAVASYKHDNYEQNFPFFRARAYRPGEIVSLHAREDKAPTGGGRTIFLSEDHDRADVVFVPAPIDVDAARFHGLLLRDGEEPERDRRRYFVSDIGKFFSRPGEHSDYYCDPDVSRVAVRTKLLNGASRPGEEQFLYEDGVYCQAAKHLQLDPVELAFGRPGEWERFRPVVISFRTTDDLTPSMHHDSRSIEIRVPRAGHVEVSVVPLVSPSQLVRTASYAASNSQLARNPTLEATAQHLQGWLPIPAMAEQVIRVAHATKLPLQTPRLIGVPLTVSAPTAYLAVRPVGQEVAELRGRIEIDAASTGHVHLEATWQDIEDNVTQKRYILMPGATKSVPRNVVFRRYTPQRADSAAYMSFLQLLVGETAAFQPRVHIGTGTYLFTEQFELQCAENKVFLGPPEGEESSTDAKAKLDVLNFKDARRKLATVRAFAQSRFVQQLPAGGADNHELGSAPILVDIPASMRMTSPKVSHILPMVRATVEKDRSGQITRTAYAMRVYVLPRWFESGPGERLAGGCMIGEHPNIAVASLDKRITQWGEDPIERPHLQSTERAPRAADFTAPEGGTPPSLDPVLYPDVGTDSRHDVIYRDNVPLPHSDDGTVQRVSVASFALREEPELRLWYCDIQVSGDFSGWCGLALYRHQPHAHEGFGLSETADWAYAAVLKGDTITMIEGDGKLHVTVGPLYDPNIRYEFQSLEFLDGVSENLAATPDDTRELQRYRVNGAYYFEGVVPSRERRSNLIKKRFGYMIGGAELTRPR